jgi:phage terminase small subunit
MPRKNPAVAQTPSARLTTSAGDIAAPVVECPPELGPVARQEWDRIVPQLIAANRITGLDRGVLAAYASPTRRGWTRWPPYRTSGPL